jgi:hypothetical protein
MRAVAEAVQRDRIPRSTPNRSAVELTRQDAASVARTGKAPRRGALARWDLDQLQTWVK